LVHKIDLLKKFAVIVAAGSGTRMGYEIPKQFLHLSGVPIILRTSMVFLETFPDMKFIVVVGPGNVERARQILEPALSKTELIITEGGSNRFQSVRNGLNLVEDDSIVFIHDAVRCLLTGDLIKRSYESAIEIGNAIPAVTSSDSVRIGTLNENQFIDRNLVFLIQTPQSFKSILIKSAFNQTVGDSFTDEASVLESTGVKINLIKGEKTNIKITHPSDLKQAEAILGSRT
jgi:2-C-methyl-D-erythritol 4-phosphate cytidylyltransferase